MCCLIYKSAESVQTATVTEILMTHHFHDKKVMACSPDLRSFGKEDSLERENRIGWPCLFHMFCLGTGTGGF